MVGNPIGDGRCPVIRSRDVLAEKWTLMIVRDALLGSTQFSEFHRSLGVPKEVLTARLRLLVDTGVMRRSPYNPAGGRVRQEYLLTDAGRDLSMVLLALGDWADRHRPALSASDLRFAEVGTDETVTAAAVADSTGRPVPVDRLSIVRGDDVRSVRGDDVRDGTPGEAFTGCRG